jgi:hypothetical protein
LNDIEGFGGDFAFVIYKSFGQRFTMSKLGKERLLKTMFKNITSEEKEAKLRHDLQILYEQVCSKAISCR